MFNLLWLQSAGCGGCTMSLLNAEGPDLITIFDSAGINLLWHPSLSEETGTEMRQILDRILTGEIRLDVLCVEGSMLRGPNGSGMFHVMGGTQKPMIHWVRELSEKAAYTVAIGSCAAYGGISAAGSNHTDATGLQYEGEIYGGLLGSEYRSGAKEKVVNISGCPVHPNWVTDTLVQLALGEFSEDSVDALGRPRMYADQLVHHGCNRNEYYEYKASAEQPGDRGCMMENMGCLGTQAHADCNVRPWNGTGSCTKGGYACINCTAPEFEEPRHTFTETPKIAGIPVGLPTDMPKAWFVALASLSKAATPERLRENATSERLIYPPTIHKRKR
ncbi:NADH-quinone oxidoreductase subunit B family protein [Marinobacterium jannaschii]|uniref:NADH-quinone oxidoreductase subunit B family protein n=1 Tax=Marinobacterium jannaschii TaxID=64970 RepID=UPI000569F95F|nr:HupU protein [Marinobacterium jannaschii]